MTVIELRQHRERLHKVRRILDRLTDGGDLNTGDVMEILNALVAHKSKPKK
jgi:hypothetical protein